MQRHIQKYNDTYAKQENEDVLYAAIIAAWWLNLPDNSLVTYMTQGDERVRAWRFITRRCYLQKE